MIYASGLRQYWLVLFFVFAVLILHLFVADTRIRYDMYAIGDGEYWRLISSSFSHKDWMHLLLNLAVFFVLVMIFPGDFVGIRWLALFFMIILITNLIIMVIYADKVSYSGLSGPLHGLVYSLALTNISRIIGKLLLALLLVKLALEQLVPEWLFSYSVLDTLVFYDSHLIGAIAAVWVQILVRMANRRAKS